MYIKTNAPKSSSPLATSQNCLTLQRHSRTVLAGIQRIDQQRVLAANLDARQKHSGMTRA
jgi:hypothetical protein